MTFEEVVDQAIAMLQRRGRVTYGLLKRQFNLDDAALADLVNDIVYGQQLASDEDGRVLIWKGDTTPKLAVSDVSLAVTSARQHQEPLAYTPTHLVEKILTTRSTLEGERKQVTVLFCDLACGALTEAETHLQEALQAFVTYGIRPEAARTYLDLATVTHAQGNADAAGAYLCDAHALFTALQAPAYVERTEQLARTYGRTLSDRTPHMPAHDEALP